MTKAADQKGRVQSAFNRSVANSTESHSGGTQNGFLLTDGGYMSHRKPEPIFHSSQPNLCPICGKASYSSAGIHPQCAVKQADDKRRLDLKQNKSETKVAKPNSTQPPGRWQKSCPKCKASQHVRKKTCDCGHTFAKTLNKPS